MKELTDIHYDAFAEMFNIGAGRAALSLSEIVGEEVQLSVPTVKIIKSELIQLEDVSLTSSRFGAVTQHFSGQFEAQAVLLFTEENALRIVRDMMGSEMSVEEVTQFESEAMCELGNIILNACLSSIADTLHVALASSLPHYIIESGDVLLKRIRDDANYPYILMLHIDLCIETRMAEGRLVFLLSSSSLGNIIDQIDEFIGNLE